MGSHVARVDGGFNTELATMQNDLLAVLASNQDLMLTRTPLDSQQAAREAISLHALNHVTKYVHVCYFYSSQGPYN